jgi:predicted metal-binding protein
MSSRRALQSTFEKHGYADFKWIQPQQIIVAQWVRVKCMFGCGDYGSNASCPPNVPSVAACRRFFDEYSLVALFRFEKKVDQPQDRFAWTKKVNQGLLKLEREVFLAGYQKAFLLFMDSCHLCAECPGVREKCKNPRQARPSPEAMAVDVFSTVRQVGYPIEVLSEYSQPMNRYAILLIE